MGQVDVPDIPRTERLDLNATTTAVIVVDMQNDFAHPDGALYGEEARAALPRIAELLARARARAVAVVYTQDWHAADDPEFALWGEHARADSWGAQVVDELAPTPGDVTVHKLRYDAFYGTPLDHLLRTAGVTDVVIVGTVANICVLHTAGSAALRGYRVIVAEDGIGALSAFDRAAALRQVTFLYGGSVTTTAGVRFVGGAPPPS